MQEMTDRFNSNAVKVGLIMSCVKMKAKLVADVPTSTVVTGHQNLQWVQDLVICVATSPISQTWKSTCEQGSER